MDHGIEIEKRVKVDLLKLAKDLNILILVLINAINARLVAHIQQINGL